MKNKITTNTDGLDYYCVQNDRECQNDPDTKCCYTNNCNKPPSETIPSTSLENCFIGNTYDGIGALVQLNGTKYNTNDLGQFKACSVKSFKDPFGILNEIYEMASSCKSGTAVYPYYQFKTTCCTTSGCNKLTSSPSLPSKKVTSCLVGESNPISKTCDSQNGVSFSFCAVFIYHNF